MSACVGMSLARAGRGAILLYLLVGLPAAAQSVSFPERIDTISQYNEPACEQAGRQAERAYALPAGLLLAIGRVESGRWDATRRRVVPWPWALDAGGNGRLFDSKDAAVTQTAMLRGAGVPNIDVGCFQIDLTSHPLAFASLEQAFDPVANADYAARFLIELHARLGNWDAAIAGYHSLQPERGAAYRQLVFANWALRDHPATNAAPTGPLVVQFASGERMSVWTPGNVGVSVSGVTVMVGTPAPLPRVIVGTSEPRG
jgi:hypothetical protein